MAYYIRRRGGVLIMYCCCDCKFCCFFGFLGFFCTIIQFIIICSLLVLIYNLIFKRIAIEPVHHCDGTYRWAFTKNGQPIKWFGKKKNNENNDGN
jgi:hypothetical protein